MAHIGPSLYPSDDDEPQHPLVADGFLEAEHEFMPCLTAKVGAYTISTRTRYACSAALAGCVSTKLMGRRPSILGALVAPGLAFGVAVLAETAARFVVSRLHQWHATAVQKRALLEDVRTDFADALPLEMKPEDRVTWTGARGEIPLFRVKASLTVTPIWLVKTSKAGWTWSADLENWHSVNYKVHRGSLQELRINVEARKLVLFVFRCRKVRIRRVIGRSAEASVALA